MRADGFTFGVAHIPIGLVRPTVGRNKGTLLRLNSTGTGKRRRHKEDRRKLNVWRKENEEKATTKRTRSWD
jgi:hypothetical protein